MPLMTLVEYAKQQDRRQVSTPLIESFALSSDIYGALPFENMTGPVYEYFREAALPESMAFRGINEGSTSGRGVLEPLQEASYILDHDIDVDAAIVRRHGEGRRAKEDRLGMAKAGRLWADTFINGDNSTEPREFNGLKARATAANGKLTVNDTDSGGGPLSLTKLDEAINQVSKPTHIIAPRTMIPLFIGAARTTSLAGFVMQSWDQVGMPKLSYGGLPFLFGYDREIEGDLLNFDEVGAGGGSAVTASLYVVSFGENGVRGLQLKPMTILDKGELEDGITLRTHLSWDVGLVDEHHYSVHRLTSITNEAIVA